jgi:uncharacterized membrane protein
MKPLPDFLIRQILIVHFGATCAMAGVIWIVQLVIYPQFADVGAEAFPAYHRHYTDLVTLVVGPLMLVEIVTAIFIVAKWRTTPRLDIFATAGLATVLLLWIITALVQVPAHERLADGPDTALVGSLVAGNWVRTALWTVRVPIAWVILAHCPRAIDAHLPDDVTNL